MVRLRNKHPLGDVDIPVLGGVIRAGAEFDAPEDIAGEPAGVWREPTDAERAEGLTGLSTREAGEAPHVRVEVLSPGSGLLGGGMFEPVEAVKAPTPVKEA